MTIREKQVETYQAIQKRLADDKCQFKANDAVVVVDGEYRGWVGYAQGNEDKELGIVPVRLFDSDGVICSADVIVIDYVKNIEPEYKPNWNY